MTTNNSDLQNKIFNALTSGESVSFSFAEFDISSDDNVIYVTVSFENFQSNNTYPKLTSVLSASSLMGGTGLAELIPVGSSYISGIFNEICLKDVNFTLYTQQKTIGSISCDIGFGKNAEGATWSPFKGQDNFSATLDTISISLVNPLKQDDRLVIAHINGKLQLGKNGQFNVSLGFPEITLEIHQVPSTYCTVNDLLSALGITVGTSNNLVNELLNLAIENFNLQADVTSQSASLSADIVELDDIYSQPTKLVLIDKVLAIDTIALAFDYEPRSTSASFNAQMEFLTSQNKTGLIFHIGATYQHAEQNDTLTVSGIVNVGGTIAAWKAAGINIDTSVTKLYLKDLSQQLFDLALPDALGDLYIGALSASYTKTNNDDSSYQFYGVIGGDWTISGNTIDAQIEINLSTDQNSIEVDFDFDGFVFDLGYDFDQKIGTVAIPELDGLKGTYDFTKEIATLQFDGSLDFEEIVEWFVGSITGNPGYEFGEPWKSVFGILPKPSASDKTFSALDQSGNGLEFIINLAKGQRSISVSIPVSGLNFPFDISINHITIGYEEGKELLLGVEGHFPFLINADGSQADSNKLQWNPAQPGTEPSVSGIGANYFDLQVLALGQRIAYPTPAPSSVEAAINALITALQPDESQSGTQSKPPIFPKTLNFDPNSSWLIGSKFVLMGQIVTELIFNDPQMYGAMLKIVKMSPNSPGNAKLNAFAGLYFEIMYRKVTDTIGEYYAAVTLPEQFRTIDLGEVVIHLPSFSLAIYTNGNFKIDIGFPYKADFSLSFGATYLVFTGLGGFYFGSLDGATAAGSLPSYDKKHWSANPVIEVGLGISVGIQRGFSAGPLNAMLSVMLQAILQGTFVEFRRTSSTEVATSGQDQVLYYKVSGLIRFVGELTGSVDLVIINASFTVEVILSAGLTIEEYKKSIANLSATVDIRLSVKIGVGFFSFHIHVSFHHTVSTSFSFGEASTPPYLPPTMQAFAEALFASNASAPKLQWTAITPPNKTAQNLTTYFVPQLTFAGSTAKGSSNSGSPFYVGMLYLSHPIKSDTGTTFVNTDDAFNTFAEGVFLWLVNAYKGNNQSNDSETINGWTLDQNDVATINQLLNWTDDTFTLDQMNSFTTGYFKLVIQIPAVKGNYGLSGFPLPSGLSINSSLPNTQSALVMQKAYMDRLAQKQSDQPLQHLTVEGKKSIKATPNADTHIADQIMSEYLLTTARQLANAAASFVGTGSGTVSDIFTGLTKNGAVDQCAGFLSRFLLHGMRKIDPTTSKNTNPGDLTNLFTLTGQQFSVIGDQDSLSVSLAPETGTTASWQIEFPNGGTEATVQSGATDSLICSPKALASSTHAFAPTGVQAGELNIFKQRDHLYRFNLSGPSSFAGTNFDLWKLPGEMRKTIADHKGDLTFSLHQMTYSPSDSSHDLPDPLPNIATSYQWLTVLDFNLTQIKSSSGDYLPSAFQFSGADSSGLFLLVELLTQALAGGAAAPTIADVYIGYQENNAQQFIKLDAGGLTPFSLVRTNLSTESRPQNTSANILAAVEDSSNANPITDFLVSFWAAAITNNGGYYLHYDNNGDYLPADLFKDKNGVAQLKLAITVTPPASAAGSQPGSYINYLATQLQTTNDQNDIAYFAQTDQIKQSSASIDPGHVGIVVTRDAPPTPTTASNSNGAINYNDSLDNLYSLLTCTIESTGSYTPTAPVSSYGISTQQAPASSGIDSDKTMYFKKVFSLTMPTQDVTGISNPDLAGLSNPYASVGLSTSFFAQWTDVYGNLLPDTPVGLNPITNGYFDPVPSLASLPNLAFVYSFAENKGSAQLTMEFLFKQQAYQTIVQSVQTAFSQISAFVPAADWKACTTLQQRIAVIESAMEAATSPATVQVLTQAQQTLFNAYRKLENDRQKYGNFYYQLLPYSTANKSATIAISSSLLKPANNSQLHGQITYTGDELRNNAKAIYQSLLTLEQNLGKGVFDNAVPATTLSNIVISSGFEQNLQVDQYLFVLDLSVSITRQGCIHSNFTSSNEVLFTNTIIAPKPDQWTNQVTPAANDQSSDTPAYRYSQFASDFAAAFASASMQLATGVVTDAGTSAQDKQIWVVRYGNKGLNLSFNSKHIDVFSSAPISTQLVSKSGIALGQVYNPDSGKLEPSQVSTSITNVDLDAQMKQVLSLVEQYLSPEYSVPASQIPTLTGSTTTPFAQLIAAKEALANKLCSTLTNQNGGSPYGALQPNQITPAMQSAVAKLKQECLTSLNSYYQLDAIINTQLDGSFNMTNGSTGAAVPLNVFGSPNITNADDNLSLTSAKASVIQGTSQLTFGLKSHKPRLQADYSGCSLNFTLGAIEHDMASISVNGEDYTSGSWLRFINPTDPLTIGTSDILIPLRAYPVPPSLIGQSYKPTISGTTKPELIKDSDPLAQAKEWNFICQYNHHYTAQDNVYVEFSLNTVSSGKQLFDDDALALTDALTCFNYNYPLMSNTLEKLTSGDISNSVLQYSVQSFAQLVTAIANANWPIQTANGLSDKIGSKATYKITEYITKPSGELLHASEADDPTSGFYIKVTEVDSDFVQKQVSSNQTLPVATVSGYYALPVDGSPGLYQIVVSKKNPTPISVAQAQQLPSRTVTLEGINIIDHQSGDAAVRVGRNENLPQAFWYETPFISFPDRLLPHLDENNQIQITQWTTGGKQIQDYLQGAVQEILKDSKGDYSTQQGGVKIVGYYEYDLQNNPDPKNPILLSVPVHLALPVKCTLNPVTDSGLQGLINTLGDELNNWAYNNQPAYLNDKQSDKGKFRFDLTVFSDSSVTGHPLLRLRNLYLPASAVTITKPETVH